MRELKGQLFFWYHPVSVAPVNGLHQLERHVGGLRRTVEELGEVPGDLARRGEDVVRRVDAVGGDLLVFPNKNKSRLCSKTCGDNILKEKRM